jgi:hypothetical protein
MNDEQMIQSIRRSYTKDQLRYQLKKLNDQRTQCLNNERRNLYDKSIMLFKAALKGM